jgi:hypothetical protein
MKSMTQDTRHKSQEGPLQRTVQLFIALWLLSPMTAHACAVCFGNKDSLQTKGTMAGVLFLLIVIVAVLAGFAVTFIRWGLRERALQASFGPPSSEPGHS